MGNVTLLMLIFFVIFAILGVQLFEGQFYTCNDSSVNTKAECVGTFLSYDPTQEAMVPTDRVWANQYPNFDNMGQAMMSLFTVMSLDSYLPILYSAQSTRGIVSLRPAPETKPKRGTNSPLPLQDMNPQYGANAAAVLYFIAFIVFVPFLMLNLYVGVMFFQARERKNLAFFGGASRRAPGDAWRKRRGVVLGQPS